LELVDCRTWQEVADAIRRMRVRGAPAIGVTAAYGLALAAQEYGGDDPDELTAFLERAAAGLASTRPTAINLTWALNQGRSAARTTVEQGVAGTRQALLDLAERLADDDVEACRRMGTFGAELVPAEAHVLTHCNAGALATVDYGTALGVIRAAAEAGKRPH